MSAATRRALIAAGLALVVVLVFGRAVGYGFVELDDHGYVADNPNVLEGVSPHGLAWAATTFKQANWHPLTWISLMIDASLGGGRPAMFHAGNIAWHAAATVLLFLFLARATGCGGPSAATALLFAIHPLRVESVVWIAERKDVLSMALGFGALYAWASWVEQPSGRRYAAALGLFAASLLAKPTLVSLPLLMLLLDRWPFDRFDLAARTREKIPFFACSAGSAALTFVAQSRGGAVSGLTAFPLAVRLQNAAVAAVDYLRLTVWPHPLATPYPYDASRLTPARVGISVVILAVLTLMAARAWKSRPHLAVGWGWFLVSLLPVIGIVQVGSQSMADRYTYLPLVGPVWALAWELYLRWKPAAATAAIAIPAAALAAVAFVHTALWRDTRTLLTHAIAVTGPNAIAHQGLAWDHVRGKRFEEAIPEFRSAIAIYEPYAQAWTGLGEAERELGRLDEAIAAYRRALGYGADDGEVRSKLAAALTSQGTTRMRAGDAAGAEVSLREALSVIPDNAPAHAALGVVLARAGRLDDAERELTRALRLDPGNAGFAGNLDRIRAMKVGAPR